MKFTESWLKEWVSFKIPAVQLAEKLTHAGLETTVSSLQEVITFNKVITGKITKVILHPRSEYLKICTVDCGIKYIPEKIIVCGATNVEPGLRVAVALPGASLSNTIAIEPRVIRGIDSHGMLCSLEELGLKKFFQNAAKEGEIWELPFDIPLGEDLRQYLCLNDAIFDVQVSPNRGDCLSMLGIAREVGVLTQSFVTQVEPIAYPVKLDMQYLVKIKAELACSDYRGCLIKGISRDAKTPFWMADRLARSGIQTIHPAVDVTNYVLLERGIPLHVFDADTLSDQLFVRFAHKEESLQLLNGKTIILSQDTLVIADEKGPQALAGIMGGMASAVMPHTLNLFLESASFDPTVIIGRARRYGLSTEASQRFERGIDPNACQTAMLRTIDLILNICGGKAGPVTAVESQVAKLKSRNIHFKLSHIRKLLGITVPIETVLDILSRLEISVMDQSEHQLKLRVPSWRFDLENEVDIIEEIARVYGYHNIPSTLPLIPFYLSSSTDQSLLMDVRKLLTNQGYSETIHYSFLEESEQKLLEPNVTPVVLKNPISTVFEALRTNLWVGLLETIKKHQQRQLSILRFFEIGTVFLTRFEGIMEQTRIAGIITGNVLPKQWGSKARPVDFFDLKKTVEDSLQLVDSHAVYTYQADMHPALHEKEASRIYRGEKPIGWLGALHPKLYSHYEISSPTYLFEWRLTGTTSAKAIKFRHFSKFPAIRRDLALWVPHHITFHQVVTAIQKIGGSNLQEIVLFDVYQKESNTKYRSLALECRWQHFERTLTTQEVDTWKTKVINGLQQIYGITLRDH